ncbi:MAG: phosphoenolpyruvate--protein phosphotransferase [Candidatus Zhuqueibacterota bacterium]
MEDQKRETHTMLKLEGIPAAPGIVIGTVFIVSSDSTKVNEVNIPRENVDEEIQKFHRAIEMTRQELSEIQVKAKQKIGQQGEDIFDVHQLILDDKVISDQTIQRIQEERKNADFIYSDVLRKYQQSLETVDNDYFKGRLADINDVKRRLIRNIQGKNNHITYHLKEPAVVVAHDLTPSDTVLLDRRKVLAFATDKGGKTSHAAIMARSLEIPSVVGLKDISCQAQNGETIIVDGLNGIVIIRPTSVLMNKYLKLRSQYHELTKELSKIRNLPGRTLDGKDVELSANLEFADEINSIINYGARGIGLYRTEYLYLAKQELPTEEEEFLEYYKVASTVNPHPVIIRTLDIGGDKNPRSFQFPVEENPFLGWRAIRFCLEEVGIFKTQLRAILRASVMGNVKILLPMIAEVEEILKARQIIEEVKLELRQAKIPFDKNIEIGAMIEVPSAAVMADVIAEEVNFLSIGTNDLIQYMLAVDRGNMRIAHLYKRLPPSVLRMIKTIVDKGHSKGVWVGMCGEMAADPLATLILIGLELDELSVTSAMLPEIKNIIRSVTFADAQRIAEKALSMKTSEQVENYIRNVMSTRYKMNIS